MQPPGTYRVSDGSRVEFPAAIAAWTSAAQPVLERVAGSYHATITYKELGEEVQEVTGIKTRVLLMNWIGQVLGGVSRESHLKGQPMLSPELAPAGPVSSRILAAPGWWGGVSS